jgi:hypothetical protein
MKKRLPLVLLAGLLPIAPLATADDAVLRDYRAVFQYIVDNEDIPVDKPDLFNMAAESVVDHVQTEPAQWFLVVKPDLLNEKHGSMLRGAQGNGPFYVFRETPQGFEVLGTMFGNGYKAGSTNGRLQLRTTSHGSAEISQETVYEVEGHRLVKR